MVHSDVLCQGLSLLTEGTYRQKYPLQNQDHSGNRPHFVSGFALTEFWEAYCGFEELSRTCEFRQNPASFDKWPSIRLSVVLNSRKNFLVTFHLRPA